MNAEGFDALSAHHRARYLADDLCTADRRVLAYLEAAGWVDIGHALGDSRTPTVPTSGFSPHCAVKDFWSKEREKKDNRSSDLG